MHKHWELIYICMLHTCMYSVNFTGLVRVFRIECTVHTVHIALVALTSPGVQV